MRPINLLIAACAVGFASAFNIRESSTLSNITNNSSLIDGITIPECAYQCVSAGFQVSSCTTADLPCLCTNLPLQATLSGCVAKLCTFAQQEDLSSVQRSLCQDFPVPFRGHDLKVISIVFLTITIPIIFLRLASRAFIAKYVGWDDYVIVVAGALLIAMSVFEIINVGQGFGLHIWYITPSKLKSTLQYFWICEMIYIVALSVTKISILLFFNRIFVSRWFLISVRTLLTFVVLYAITFTLVLAFQCYPVRSFWDRSLDRKCVNTQAAVYASAAISIFQDFLILLLPIPELVSLQVSMRKRINVMVMFSVGLVALATSCLRLKYIIAFDDSLDTTWDDIPASQWSIIEINVSIICACLPSLRAIATRFFPSIFHSSSVHNQYYYTSNNAGLKTPSNRIRTPSRPVADFITMPEDLAEANYREDFELRNNNNVVFYATRPLSEHEFDLVRTKTEKRSEYSTNEVYASSQASTREGNPSSMALVVSHKDQFV